MGHQDWLYWRRIHSLFYCNCTSKNACAIRQRPRFGFRNNFQELGNGNKKVVPKLKGFRRKLNYRRESSSFVTRSVVRFATVAATLMPRTDLRFVHRKRLQGRAFLILRLSPTLHITSEGQRNIITTHSRNPISCMRACMSVCLYSVLDPPAKMKATPEVNMSIFLFLAPNPQPQSTRATSITAPATKKNHAELITASEIQRRRN